MPDPARPPEDQVEVVVAVYVAHAGGVEAEGLAALGEAPLVLVQVQPQGIAPDRAVALAPADVARGAQLDHQDATGPRPKTGATGAMHALLLVGRAGHVTAGGPCRPPPPATARACGWEAPGGR